MHDLTKQRFGKLVVKELVVKKPYSKRSWLCECDCGNTCTRLESTLLAGKRDGRVSSCGCFMKSYLIPGNSEKCRNAGTHRKDSFVNGSNVQMTFREGTIKGNTSGVQGVSWSKTAKKWHVYVGYQNRRATLGFYEDIEDAKKIRALAEEAIKNNTLEDFYFQVRGKSLQDTVQQTNKKKKT